MPTKRKIIRIIGYLLFALLLALFIYTLLFYQELKTGLENEIQAYGAIGLVIAAFLVDTVGGPLGTEVPVIGGLLAGIRVPAVIYWTTLGSVMAALLVFSIGYFFGETGALAYTSKEKYDRWRRVFIRHRRITMSLAALTPVPYVTVCVIAGTFKVRLWEFLVFTIGARVIRIVSAAYIVLLFQGRI